MRWTDKDGHPFLNMDTVPTVHTQSGQRMARLLRRIFGLGHPPRVQQSRNRSRLT